MDSGVDPATFSHGLCHYMSSLAESTDPTNIASLRPATLLQEAYDNVTNDPQIHAGGSTACLAIAHPSGQIQVANLGDSGFVHLRPGKVHYTSTPQTHAFNTPYQLSLVPAAMQAQSKAFGGEMLQDTPQDAETTHHTVRHGDILIFASDGVWDNLSPADILTTTSQYMTQFHAWPTPEENSTSESEPPKPPNNPEPQSLLNKLTLDGGIPTPDRNLQAALAIAITGEAKIASLDKQRDGPFAREVQRYYPGEEWRGGKVDDVCVVVGVVVENGRGEGI